MDAKDHDVLRRHWSSLRKDLEPIRLLPFLVDVLDTEDEQEVKAGATRRDMVDTLLDILPRKGPEAFGNFLNALKKIQPHLAAPLIQESENEEMKTRDQKEDQEKKETLSTLSITQTSPLQQVCPQRLEPSSSQEKYFTIAKYSKQWKKVPTILQLLPIIEDLGDRWQDLGTALNLKKAEIRNIDGDFRYSRDKARFVLLTWIKQKGRDATIGRLAAAINKIGEKSTAQTLLEQLETEEEGEEGYGLQQESNDELREETSSQILRIPKEQCQSEQPEISEVENEELKSELAEGSAKLQRRVQVVEDEVKTLRNIQLQEHLGVSASHPQEKASKRRIFADMVTEEGSSWILKETGVCVTFSSKAVPDPKLIIASLWRPSTASPPLEENEMLVSNVIELACDDPVGITFSGVTVALSHSATDLRGYELVMKELTNSEDNVWKDLETWCLSDSLIENAESQSELRFAQAKITSFSMYAVTCRLKSYTFSSPISQQSPEYTCTCPEYPEVSVTIPTRSCHSTEDFTLTMKVQEVANDDYEERRVFLGPILHISCSLDVELQEPALIRIPITLQQDQIKLPDPSSSHVRIFYRSKKDKSQGWVEITRQLETPAKVENGVVTFQVNHFCEFTVVTDPDGIVHHIPDPSMPQHAGFLACLCDTGNPEEYLLILCCFPIHLRSVVKKDIVSTYTVALQGDDTSLEPLTKDDQAFFSLPDELALREQRHIENPFLRFLGHDYFKKDLPVRVESTGNSLSIEFFKQKEDQEKKETLCTLSITKTAPIQQVCPQRLEPSTSQEKYLTIAKNSKLWNKVPTVLQLLPIVEDLGDRWLELGMALNLKRAEVSNIGVDYTLCRQKAYAVLWTWMEQKGRDATIGHLVDAMNKIGKKSTAQTLLEQLETEEEGEEGYGLQQESNDELREKKSSQILRIPEGRNQTCSRCHDLKTLLDALRTEMKTEHEIKTNQLQLKHNEEIKTLKREKNDMETKNEITTLKITESTQLIKELEQQIENLRKEKNEIELQLRDKSDKKAEMGKELKNTKKELVKAVKKKDCLEEQNKNSSQFIIKLNKEKEKLKKEKEALQSQLDTQRNELTRECDQVKDERNRLSSETELLRNEVTELQSKCEELQGEIVKTKNFVNRAFLPSFGKDFHKCFGVIRTLITDVDVSAKPIATRSSDGPGKPSDIFNHRIGTTSGTKETPGSWWRIDLGKNYLLVITHYALRHGRNDDESILRNWQLEGSIDGISWKKLETSHKRDDPPQFKDPHPFVTGTWSVEGKVGAFRSFRILQTGPNSSGSYGIYLSGVELYGILFDGSPVKSGV